MNDLPEPPLADFPTACTAMHDHDPIDCAPERAPKVYVTTTTAVIGTALNAIEDAREHLQAGQPASVIDAQLYLAHEQLTGIVLRALDARDERARREAEYEQTGTITFPNAA